MNTEWNPTADSKFLSRNKGAVIEWLHKTRKEKEVENTSMKLIIAIIRPHQLPAVKKALYESQVYTMTVTNAMGSGRGEGYQETFRGVRHEVTLLKKVRLEIAVNEDFVDATVDAIMSAAYTGDPGDGKIFVLELPECIRIRTGERGPRAIG